MPYRRSLQQYLKPEVYREFPEPWMKQLREISPIVAELDHLIPRWFDSHPSWGQRERGWPERGQWMLYSAKDIRLVDAERAAQFDRHWSEMPEGEQVKIREGRDTGQVHGGGNRLSQLVRVRECAIPAGNVPRLPVR